MPNYSRLMTIYHMAVFFVLFFLFHVHFLYLHFHSDLICPFSCWFDMPIFILIWYSTIFMSIFKFRFMLFFSLTIFMLILYHILLIQKLLTRCMFFFVKKIFITFGVCVFQQTADISVGTDWVHRLADLYLYSYLADSIHEILVKSDGTKFYWALLLRLRSFR